jgi:hypothetical protein
VQIGEQCGHLVLREAAREGWHVVFAGDHDALDFCVGGWNAAGKIGLAEDAVQVGWDLLQGQVVFLMAVGTAGCVEALAFELLRGEGWLGMAAAEAQGGPGKNQKSKNKSLQDEGHRVHSCMLPRDKASRLDMLNP